MPLFAVSHINWSDNDLTTHLVIAPNWREAAVTHPKIAECFALQCYTEGKHILPEDQQEAKQLAFDMDSMINVIEVPQG